VYIVVAVLAAVGLYVGVQVLESPVVGLLIAGVAVIGGLYLLNRETSDGDGFFSTPESHRSESADDDHDAVDDVDAAPEPPRRPRASTATAEPLATWEGEGLTPWTPPEAATDDVVVEEDEIELDALDLAELDHIDEFIEAETESDTVDELSDLDLDELLDTEPADDFDAFDPDAFSKDNGFGGTLTAEPEVDEPVDLFDEIQQIEDVHSDDDIMKASEATSLEHTGAAAGGADNSELAKLLAKVQSRLAAYE
jgi:hypothetical protein